MIRWVMGVALALLFVAGVTAAIVTTRPSGDATVELVAETPEGVKVYRVRCRNNVHYVVVDRDGRAGGMSR